MSAIFKIQSWIPITFRVESKGNMGPGDSTVQCVDRCVSILVCSSDHILHPDSWCTQTSCTSSISHLDNCSRLCAHNPLPICSNTSLFKDTRDQIESLKIFTAPGVLEMQQDCQVVSGLSRTLDCGVPTIPVSTLPSPVWHVAGLCQHPWGWLCSEMLPGGRGGQALEPPGFLSSPGACGSPVFWRVIVTL